MGSSGGGGSSGAVSHSAYLEAVHQDWLNATGVDVIEKSITEVMDSALGNSPWTGLAAYNPNADIVSYEAALAAFAVILAGISETGDWAGFYAQADTTLVGVGDAILTNQLTAYSDMIDDNINAKVLPRFRRGMQDINAVVSSAFVIGASVIEGFRDRDVANFGASLYARAEDKKLEATGQIMQLWAKRIGWEESYARMIVEAKRIKIVAKKEESDQNETIAEEDGKWDLEVFQYGANVMAAIAGGVAGSKLKPPNKLASAIGGGMTGAAAGGMIGGAMAGGQSGSMAGPYGAAIGAVLGAAVGYLTA